MQQQSAFVKGDAPEQPDDDGASPPRPPSLLHPGREDYAKEKARRRGPELILEGNEGAPIPIQYAHGEDGVGTTKKTTAAAGRSSASYATRPTETKPRASTSSIANPRPSTNELPGNADAQSPLMARNEQPNPAPPPVTFYAVEATLVPDPPPYASYQQHSYPAGEEPVYDAVRVPDIPDDGPGWREEWARHRLWIVLGVPYVWLALQLGKLMGFLWGELRGLVSFLLGR